MQTITPLKPTIPATAQRDPQPTTPWVKCSPLPPAPPLLSSMDLTANDPVLHHPSTSITVSISIITADAQSQLVIGSKTLSAGLPTKRMKSPTRSSLLFHRVFGSSTRVLATPSRFVITTAPVFTLGSQAVTPNSQFACVIDHQTYNPAPAVRRGRRLLPVPLSPPSLSGWLLAVCWTQCGFEAVSRGYRQSGIASAVGIWVGSSWLYLRSFGKGTSGST